MIVGLRFPAASGRGGPPARHALSFPASMLSRDALRRIAAHYGFELSDEEVSFYYGLIDGTLASYRRVGELPEPKPEVTYPRTPGRAPVEAENRLRAWYWRCSVKGAPAGKLAGRRSR